VLAQYGFKCSYVSELHVEVKATCPTIREFDETDTYGNIAERIVSQMLDGNPQDAHNPPFTAFGIGVHVYDGYGKDDDWQPNEGGDPCTWIHAFFLVIMP